MIGIGLRTQHAAEIAATRPPVAFLEVHAENYLGRGVAFRTLERLRADYPISVHGVGLSLGSAEGVDPGHLARVRSLVDAIEPALVSEHVSWSATGGAYLNHLLPLPLTDETLGVLADNVAAAQEMLRRRLLLENPSSYLRFRGATTTEPALLAELARRTGARLLLDVNNVYVSARNLGFDPAAYLDALPAGVVAQMHLAGHAVNDADGHPVLIDDHGSRVAPPVWALYRRAIARFGAQPTLIEWDTEVPPLATLLDEAATAETVAREETRDARAA